MKGMPVLTSIDTRNPDPFASPAWRWGRATDLFRLGLGPDDLDDVAVRAGWAYLRAMSKAQTQKEIAAVREHYFSLATAHRLYRDAGPTRAQIEVLLQSGEELAVIAAATGVDTAVVAVYEVMFFHVAHIVEWSFVGAARGREGSRTAKSASW